MGGGKKPVFNWERKLDASKSNFKSSDRYIRSKLNSGETFSSSLEKEMYGKE